MTQRTIEIKSPAFLDETVLMAAGNLQACFPVTERPLALEIGCGTGHFLLEMATRHPERNFLGIDIYNKGCYKTCSKIDLHGLDNVRVMRVEARFLLAHHLQPDSLAAVYINCPDPWPKKRHRNRRLVNADFLRAMLHFLRPEGDLYFSTDFADYANDVADLIPTLPGYRNCLSAPLTTELPGYPISKYMRRFLDLGQPIHFVHLRRRPDLSTSDLPALKVVAGFRARWGDAAHA